MKFLAFLWNLSRWTQYELLSPPYFFPTKIRIYRWQDRIEWCSRGEWKPWTQSSNPLTAK